MIEALIVIGGIIGIAAVGLSVSGHVTRWWSSALYALMTAALVVLMITGFNALDTTSAIAALWYMRLATASVLVAVVCLFFLAQELVDKTKESKAEQLLRRGVFWGGVAFSVLSLSPYVYTAVQIVSGDRWVLDVSWAALPLVIYMVGVMVLLGLQAARQVRTAYRRRYGALDYRFVIVRTVSYVCTLFVVAVVFFAIAYILRVLFERGEAPRGDVFIEPAVVVATLITALAFQPIHLVLNRYIDRVLYRDNYSLSGFITRISQTLNSTNDLRVLLERTAIVVASTVKAKQAFFFVHLPEDRYMTAGTSGHSKVSPSEFDAIDDNHAPRRRVPLLTTQFDTTHPLHRMMVSHRLGLILPLYKGDTLVGFLCLGRSKGSGYTSRDIRALKTVADEITIAVQNALSVEEVKRLNDTLEQRVNSATKELRASNAQLHRLDEAKDEFISMASHQLRTPLTSIKGYISMMLEGDVGKISDEQKHVLKEAFVSSERMVRLIGDFLNVSRLQTGKFVIDKHPVDLARLVEREVDGLAQHASARGIQFKYKKPKDLPPLELDENKIQQVVMNFADNAIFYSKEKSKIDVTLEQVGQFVEFKVVDHGIGVPKSEQPQLFNKFFRATNARKARPDGTGVGLFLARKVIADHGGTIIFESTEGKGSTFGFRLPLP